VAITTGVIFITSKYWALGHTEITVSPPKINTSTLLDKLIEIEQSIGVEDYGVIRQKVREAQEMVLQLQNAFARTTRPQRHSSDKQAQ